MRDEKNLKLLIIANLHAGKKISKKRISELENLLMEKNHSVEVHYTKCKNDATEVVKQKAGGFDVIVCCGGDGTFHEILNGVLCGNDCIPIMIIPFGTTNDLAKSLKIPSSLSSAVDRISLQNVAYRDVGLFNKKEYFSYVASFGAFCEVSYGTSQKLKNLFGKFAYVFKGACYARKIKSYFVTIECDDEKIEGNFIFGAVTNSTSVAGFINLTDDEIKFDDGKLELLLLKEPKNFYEFLKVLFKIHSNKYEENFAIIRHAKNIKMRINSKVPFTLDGEYAGNFSEVEINCMNNYLKIIK